MRLEFDDGTLLRDAPDGVPHAEWYDRVDEYRAQARFYRDIRDWAGTWEGATRAGGQLDLDQSATRELDVTDAARAYPDLALIPAVQIEARDYQQAALDAWREHGRRGSVVLPTGSGKTFLGIQAIADAGVATLVVSTIDLTNQWHATLTTAFGDQLSDGIGVLGGGSHDVTAITVTTYDSAYRYIEGKRLPKPLSIYPKCAKNRLLNIEGLSVSQISLNNWTIHRVERTMARSARQ